MEYSLITPKNDPWGKQFEWNKIKYTYIFISSSCCGNKSDFNKYNVH